MLWAMGPSVLEFWWSDRPRRWSLLHPSAKISASLVPGAKERLFLHSSWRVAWDIRRSRPCVLPDPGSRISPSHIVQLPRVTLVCWIDWFRGSCVWRIQNEFGMRGIRPDRGLFANLRLETQQLLRQRGQHGKTLLSRGGNTWYHKLSCLQGNRSQVELKCQKLQRLLTLSTLLNFYLFNLQTKLPAYCAEVGVSFCFHPWIVNRGTGGTPRSVVQRGSCTRRWQLEISSSGSSAGVRQTIQ